MHNGDAHSPAPSSAQRAHPHAHAPINGNGALVAVTGATGFVGRHVVRALLASGYTVRALVRDPAKAAQVLPADRRIQLVQGDVLDRKSPANLVAGTEACIHLVGIIREVGTQTFKRMHVDATKAMLEATAATGVSRFLHMSAMGVTPDGKAEYQRTKFEAEQMVRRSGLRWTIMRPSLIHGAGGEFTSMLKAWCTGQAAPFFFIPYFTRLVEHDQPVLLSRISLESAKVAPIHVDDVARAFVAAIGNPATESEIYNLSGPDVMDWPTMLGTFRDALPNGDTLLPIIGLPALPHAYMAAAAKRIGLGGLFPFDAGQAFMAELDVAADCGKARLHLGFAPKGYKSSLASYAGAI